MIAASLALASCGADRTARDRYEFLQSHDASPRELCEAALAARDEASNAGDAKDYEDLKISSYLACREADRS